MSNISFVTLSEDPIRSEMQKILQGVVYPIAPGEKIKRLIERADREIGLRDYSRTRRYWYGLADVKPRHLDMARSKIQPRINLSMKQAEDDGFNAIKSEIDRLASRIAALEGADPEFFGPEVSALHDQSERLRSSFPAHRSTTGEIQQCQNQHLRSLNKPPSLSRRKRSISFYQRGRLLPTVQKTQQVRLEKKQMNLSRRTG